MECCDFSAGERSAGGGQAYKTDAEKGAAKGKLGFPQLSYFEASRKKSVNFEACS